MKKWIQHYDGSSFDITLPDYCDAWCRYQNVDTCIFSTTDMEMFIYTIDQMISL